MGQVQLQNSNKKYIKGPNNRNTLMNNFRVKSMQESFYREGSYGDAHSFCALHDSVFALVRKVFIQGENTRRFTTTSFLDTRRQGASM
jgi:hypothetical protein